VAGTPPLRALAARAEGVLARGERGRALLEDAVDAFAGAPYEQAETRLQLAEACSRLGRVEDAARERRAADAALRALGAASPLPELTKREREVLALLGDGLSYRQLAERLTVSEHTVHRHVTNILRKLDVPTRAAAAALAARRGV
jgi:RNA polymerase sigma factor (sigma-70 family)